MIEIPRIDNTMDQRVEIWPSSERTIVARNAKLTVMQWRITRSIRRVDRTLLIHQQLDHRHRPNGRGAVNRQLSSSVLDPR